MPITPRNLRAEGTSGEALAARFLEAKGLQIIKRNFHFGKTGEIDLIATDGNVLVFVEVKSRKSSAYGTPEEAVTHSKQKTLRRVAEGYLYVNGITDRECRFDVIAIELYKNPPEIRHLVNAF